MKILLLEDNATDADLTRRGLTGAIPDCTVDVAQTLKQAHKMLGNGFSYDLALVDMMLPDGNGMELLVEIRQSESNIPVIFLTGSGNEEVAVAALKAGANDYVIKNHGYLAKLPAAIDYAMVSHRQNMLATSEVIQVLYIEHNTADVDLTRRHILKYAPNLQISVVPTAEEALRLLPLNGEESGDCQVVLIDYRLPGLNALEFIKIIRQERKLRLPVILITGHGNEEVAIQALKLGVNEYLVKRDDYLFRLPPLILSAYKHYELVKKQAALAESEAKYWLLAENSGDVIFVLDKEMRYTYISPAIKNLRGYEVDEAIVQTLSQVLTPDSYTLATEWIGDLFFNRPFEPGQMETEKTLEFEMTCKDGSTVWTEVKGKLISDENGLPSGIVGVTRDISLRRKATEELRKLSRAVEQSPESILITNAKGDIEFCNPAIMQVTGYSREEIIGQNPRIFNSGTTSKEEYKEIWDTITSGKIWKGEFLNKRKNGELFWETASITPVTDSLGRITHYLAIKKDISEQKEMTAELIEAKEKAEENDRLKSAFLANMSHEIRTPLNSIIGFSDLLLDPFFEAEQHAEFAKIIRENGRNLLAIISDIMDLSKIEAGQVNLKRQSFSVTQLINSIRDEFSFKAKEKGIELRLAPSNPKNEIVIQSDSEKIWQILVNFVSNAIKFTKKGYIEIGIQIEGDLIQFHVKDTGIGIPEEYHDTIFERFRQVESAYTRQYGGNGLGLPISKNLAKLLGGTVWMESEVGIGSTFFFNLPL